MKLTPDLLEAKHWVYPLNHPKRDYQYNIVKNCLFENTVVALPTGLGKTFIAGVVMLNCEFPTMPFRHYALNFDISNRLSLVSRRQSGLCCAYKTARGTTNRCLSSGLWDSRQRCCRTYGTYSQGNAREGCEYSVWSNIFELPYFGISGMKNAYSL